MPQKKSSNPKAELAESSEMTINEREQPMLLIQFEKDQQFSSWNDDFAGSTSDPSLPLPCGRGLQAPISFPLWERLPSLDDRGKMPFPQGGNLVPGFSAIKNKKGLSSFNCTLSVPSFRPESCRNDGSALRACLRLFALGKDLSLKPAYPQFVILAKYGIIKHMEKPAI